MKWLNPGIWLAVLLAFAAAVSFGYWRGGEAERAKQSAQQLKDVTAAREADNDLQRINNRATAVYIDRVNKQLEKARALPKIVLPADCPVPADVGRVLNDAQLSVRADAGSGSGAGTTGPAVDSTCAAELEIAKRNYAEVCIPNAEQLTELQERWSVVQKIVNRGE
jgi:hypothetical protein